jgi:hypothetical protein
MEKISPTKSPDASTRQHDRDQRHEGFVDEGAVRSMVSDGAYQRHISGTDELALSSTEDDFAGWNLPKVASFRTPELSEPLPEAKSTASFLIHPKPVSPKPEIETTVLSEAKRGLFWWLGFSGALACTVASLAALGLVQFGDFENDTPAPFLKQDSVTPETMIEKPSIPMEAPVPNP